MEGEVVLEQVAARTVVGQDKVLSATQPMRGGSPMAVESPRIQTQDEWSRAITRLKGGVGGSGAALGAAIAVIGPKAHLKLKSG